MIENWFGIMPHTILFDKTLTDKQKLLYCFITSLCAEKWYCWASNKYIAEKLWVNATTISTNINVLKKLWYIDIIEWDNQKRKCLLKNQKGAFEKSKGEPFEKSKDNNIIYEYNKYNIRESEKIFSDAQETDALSNTEIEVADEKKITSAITTEQEEAYKRFNKAFPHARKQKAKIAKQHFYEHDADEVMKEVDYLNLLIMMWIQDWSYIPACERWIRDFTPTAENIKKNQLRKMVDVLMGLPVWEDRSFKYQKLKDVYWKEVVDAEVKKRNKEKNGITLKFF